MGARMLDLSSRSRSRQGAAHSGQGKEPTMSDEKQEREPEQVTVQALAEIASGWFETADRGANVAGCQARTLYRVYCGLVAEDVADPHHRRVLEDWDTELDEATKGLFRTAADLFGPIEEQPFVRKKAGAPDWVEGLVRVVHDDCRILPDDYRYEFIETVLDTLAEANDEDHMADLRTELEADVYTSGLTAWLHSSNFRIYYLSEVLDEFGGDLDGFQALSQAQVQEKREVFDKVLEYLKGLVESVEAGEIEPGDLGLESV